MESGFICHQCGHPINVTPVDGHGDGVEISLSPINEKEGDYDWDPLVDEYLHLRCVIKWLERSAPVWVSERMH